MMLMVMAPIGNDSDQMTLDKESKEDKMVRTLFALQEAFTWCGFPFSLVWGSPARGKIHMARSSIINRFILPSRSHLVGAKLWRVSRYLHLDNLRSIGGEGEWLNRVVTLKESGAMRPCRHRDILPTFGGVWRPWKGFEERLLLSLDILKSVGTRKSFKCMGTDFKRPKLAGRNTPDVLYLLMVTLN